MFKKFAKLKKILFLAPLMSLIFCFNAPKNDDEKMQMIMVHIKNALSYLHYSPKPINDAYSRQVYDKYFESIDPAKRYFLQSDMDEFVKHKNKLDEYLDEGNLGFYNQTIDKLYQRVEEIDEITQDILSKPIDLEEDEELILESKLKKHPANKEELYQEWKRFIKYNILQEIETMTSKEEAQKKKRDSVIAHKLKDTINVKELPLEEKKIKAKEEIKDLISHMFKRLKKRKKMDWFSVYMNAYTEVFDLHTNYFSPKDKEDFDSNFKGKVIGIGAQIQEKKGYLYMGPLVVGAPAWKSKQISEGDKILKVKAKPDAEHTNVVGMLVEEAVRLIRGEKGTEVVLTLQKKDGSVKEVKLIREEVSIEDTFARSIVVDSPKGEKYGYIYLPSFNVDFEDAKGRNASDDVKAEILKLKKQNVKGIILDVRSNGGGSLTEVVDIMGLFMKNGPVVQVKDGEGRINVLNNKTNEPVWEGALVLMQNELSASASEILAGALQDYRRGVVIGSPHSFGKGSVQTFVELNRFLQKNDDFGALKLTIQKFYRISGKSTQLKGVEADLVMNDFMTYAEVGERYRDHFLPWDQIPSAEYEPLNLFDLELLKKNSTKRLEENNEYQLLQESAKWREKLSKEEKITLNIHKFNDLMKSRKQQIKKFKSLSKYDNQLKFELHKDEQERAKKDEVFAKKNESWVKNLKKDIYLKEAINVISEMK
ncbi:MAG: carboxy terminal-processing peptidase [Flavobacteriaceae bacterium]|nr:carboxy terminal-processing peptidase [Flavobacteriaceae bacterium]